MAETKIEWCDYTFNPWRGCTRVSDGCTHCYAATMSKRNPKTLGVWGPGGTRVVASARYWRLLGEWEKKSQQRFIDWSMDPQRGSQCERQRVFVASMADVFEDWQGILVDHEGHELVKIDARFVAIRINEHEPPLRLCHVRGRLFNEIAAAPNLDFLLLTKRPESFKTMLPWTNPKDQTGQPFPNVWLGVSVEDQKTKWRIDVLQVTPAAIRFLSLEPLLEDLGELDLRGIHWVIIGGESGPHARPCNVAWILAIMRQCREAGVSCFVKQLGAVVHCENDTASEWFDTVGYLQLGPTEAWQGAIGRVTGFRDKKGGSMVEWPTDLRVREFPK